MILSHIEYFILFPAEEPQFDGGCLMIDLLLLQENLMDVWVVLFWSSSPL